MHDLGQLLKCKENGVCHKMSSLSLLWFPPSHPHPSRSLKPAPKISPPPPSPLPLRRSQSSESRSSSKAAGNPLLEASHSPRPQPRAAKTHVTISFASPPSLPRSRSPSREGNTPASHLSCPPTSIQEGYTGTRTLPHLQGQRPEAC